MKKKFDAGAFRWSGVEPAVYGETENSAGRVWRGTSRHIIKGRDEGGAFDVRYFEVEPAGFTSLERHQHVHSVVCLRGRGYAVVGEELHPLASFDHLYVAAGVPHQFVNEGTEPFGFLCIVDAQRDRPQALSDTEAQQLRNHPVVGPKIRP